MTYDGQTPILGRGTVSADAIQAWFASLGPQYAPRYAPDGQYKAPPVDLGIAILAECQRYPEHPVNWDLVAAQILHETAAWQSRYARERNNPGGIGAVNHDPDQAYRFNSVAAGVRAHVSHLLVYAVGDGDWSRYTPRRDAVAAKGWLSVAKRWADLNGRWAYPGTTYGQQIAALANRLVSFANDGSWQPMQAQIPGFSWHPADSGHYERGRREPIRGGAQHYTAGTNSLAWLARTSSPPVSVHFLIKHDPTLKDRGWQLVRIEDTAWTTAFANPYTVAIEYEHTGRGTIPDIAYEVMAQTWLDIAAYVKRHQLGEIPITRTGIRGHREWVNNPSLVCPDGIDVDRIVRIAQERSRPAPPPVGAALYFPETGHSVSGGFRAYWEQFGGLPVFGYPLTGEIVEDGLTVQYFERAVFEHHPGTWPERYDVLLRRLGADALERKQAEAA